MSKAQNKASQSKKKKSTQEELKKIQKKLSTLNKKYKNLETAYNALEKENNDTKDRELRVLAEYDNFRKRTGLEKERLIKYNGEEIITSLLATFDDLERTVSENYKDSDSIQAGISMILSNIEKILKDNEIHQFSSIGDEFNPELHEAIMQEPGKDDNIVMKELEKGYKYKDKIIRHAKVVVSSKS